MAPAFNIKDVLRYNKERSIMDENMKIDKKSLKFLLGKNPDWNELAKDCVSFANAQGGFIFIGIENDEKLPPEHQRITDKNLPGDIKKRIAECTINVGVAVTVETAANDAEYIRVQVLRSIQTIASTTDGKYYVRVHDSCIPVPPDEMARLAADKNAFVWEEQTTRKIAADQFDEQKRNVFLREVRTSQRVTRFIREKSDEEILEHYFFQKNGCLTNLGILWIGKRNDRASLLHSPSIQVIRYDNHGDKVWKLLLDDHFSNPKELLERVINEVPDWQESIEISEGIFRKNVLFFPLEVVRELLVNALVHRTYTTRGDIFINIFPDRMEIHSPGRLPFGVTPKNILSQSIRRNEHMAKVFYDLGLMEKEGSGYDLVYEKLLGLGKPLPIVKETDERVVVTVQKHFVSKEVVRLMDKADSEFSLRQKEVISLGLLAQQQSYSAFEMSKVLNQKDETGLRHWLGRLLDFGLVEKTGVGKGSQYSVNPEFLRQINFRRKTSLKNIEDHRLEELIYKDITAYPNSGFGEIHQRIGEEINKNTIKRILRKMVEGKKLAMAGIKKWARYSIVQNLQENG